MTIDADDQAKLREAVELFRKAMDERFEMNIRVARRVTTIIRLGMIGMGLMAVSMLLLVFILSYHMKDMNVAVDTMNRHFASISEDMGVMKQTIAQMDRSVDSMPVMLEKIREMRASVDAMTSDMDTMAGRMNGIDGNMAVITADIVRMRNTFAVMNGTVQGMGVDVNRMSEPMKSFNSMVPLP